MTLLLGADDARLQPSADLATLVTLLDSLTDDAVRLDVRDDMRAFIARHPDALHRTCREGHFTGSAIVVDATADRVLLLFHAKHQRWLQPGGHADGDANLASVALREATEETGIAGLRIDPDPLDLDVHPIGARPGEAAHLHLDARYLVVAPPAAVPERNHESERLEWFPPDGFDDLGLDPGTHRLIAAGLARARAALAGEVGLLG
jgi:8-oxo-dGTP pyrophosphatase MutT (NUDIX family)